MTADGAFSPLRRAAYHPGECVALFMLNGGFVVSISEAWRLPAEQVANGLRMPPAATRGVNAASVEGSCDLPQRGQPGSLDLAHDRQHIRGELIALRPIGGMRLYSRL